jgi:hypothetical protein
MSSRQRWIVRSTLPALAWLLPFSLPAVPAHAQNVTPPQSRPIGSINFGSRSNADRSPNSRTILGFVQDASGKHISGALVYLKNTKTSAVVVVNADDQGAYQFGALPLTEDYELWAVVAGQKSPVRPVSSFLTDKSVTILLKLDK